LTKIIGVYEELLKRRKLRRLRPQFIPNQSLPLG
jgi:hypothetical protein